MVAQTELVRSWGSKPCGGLVLPITTCVSAGGGAPRPPGTGRGMPEVQTLRNSALNLTDGSQQIFAGVVKWRATNEPRPSYAAAPAAFPVQMDPSLEGDRCGRTGGVLCEMDFPLSRMTGDLGTAAL